MKKWFNFFRGPLLFFDDLHSSVPSKYLKTQMWLLALPATNAMRDALIFIKYGNAGYSHKMPSFERRFREPPKYDISIVTLLIIVTIVTEKQSAPQWTCKSERIQKWGKIFGEAKKGKQCNLRKSTKENCIGGMAHSKA